MSAAPSSALPERPALDPSSDRLFPVFLDLRDRAVLVVGGGAVARRKAEALREVGARVRVGAPALCPELAALAARGEITALQQAIAERIEAFLNRTSPSDAVAHR